MTVELEFTPQKLLMPLYTECEVKNKKQKKTKNKKTKNKITSYKELTFQRRSEKKHRSK